MVSSALGKALGLTEESTLEELKDGIIGVKDRSTTIHTAIDRGGNNDNSYYRINGSNIEVCPALGYWAWTAWEKSHIKIPMANVGVEVGVITKQINRTTWDSGKTWYTIGTIPANKKVYVCAAPWNTSGSSATEHTRLQFSHGNTSILSGPSYFGGAFIFNFSTSSAITFKCRLWSNYYDGDGESVKLLIVYW